MYAAMSVKYMYLCVLVLLSLPGGSAGEGTALRGEPDPNVEQTGSWNPVNFTDTMKKINSTITSFQSNVDFESVLSTTQSVMDALNTSLSSLQSTDNVVAELKKDETGEDSASVCIPAEEVTAMYNAVSGFQSSFAQEVSSFLNNFNAEGIVLSDIANATQSVVDTLNVDEVALDVLKNAMGRMEVEGDDGYSVLETLVDYVESSNVETNFGSFVNSTIGVVGENGSVAISLTPQEFVDIIDAFMSAIMSQGSGIMDRIQGMM